jgi:hypothetical protein
MASLDFFAAHEDHIAMFNFLFTQTDVSVFDHYSEPDQELREFRSVDELEAVHPIGVDLHGNGLSLTLQLWSPSVMPVLPLERFALDPSSCDGHTFRYRLRGGGLIQLYLGGVYEKWLTKTHYGHFSSKGAARWNLEQGVDWEALSKLSNKIQYHIRKRLAVAKVSVLPVLPQAYALAEQGYCLTESANSGQCYEVPKLYG